MHPLLQRTLDQNIVFAMARQMRLEELAEGVDWGLDLEVGELRLGDRYRFDVQLLGSEAAESGTWLWGWANPSINHPAVLEVANKVRELGVAKSIPEFTSEESSVREGPDGFALAIIAQALAKAPLFYRCDTGGGWAYFLIGLRQMPDIDLDVGPRQVNEAFQVAMMSIPFNHRRALQAAAERLGLPAPPQGDLAIGDAVHSFDEHGRATGMERTVRAQGPPTTTRRRRRRRRR